MFGLYLLLITILVVNIHKIVLEHRLYIGQVPINIYEFCILFTLLNVFVSSFRRPEEIDSSKKNILLTIMGLYIISGLASTAVGLYRGVPLYGVFQSLKIFYKLPAGLLCGYLAIRNLTDVRRMIKLIGWLCFIMFFLVAYDFARGTSAYQISRDINQVRTISYSTFTAGIFAAFLIYCGAINRGYYKPKTFLVLFVFSLLASFSTLSRSEWIPLFVTIFATVWLTPEDLRERSWRMLLTSFVWVALALFIGILLATVFLKLDIVSIIKTRIETLFITGDVAENPYMSRLISLKFEFKTWMKSTILFGAGWGYLSLFVYAGTSGERIAFGHNAYTNILAEGGLMALFTLLVVLITAFKVGRKLVRSPYPDLRAIGALAITSSFFLSILSGLTGGLKGERESLYMGIVLGAALKAYRFYLPVEDEYYYDSYESGQDLLLPEYYGEY